MSKQNDKESQQAFLTVSSAADLLKDKLSGASYTLTDIYNYDEDGVTEIGHIGPDETLTMDSDFKPLLQAALDYVSAHGAEYSKNFTIKVSNLDTVYVKFRMNPDNYTVYAELSLDENAKHNHKMFLTVNTKFRNTNTNGWNEDRTMLKIIHKTTVTWNNYTIEKGGATDEEDS